MKKAKNKLHTIETAHGRQNHLRRQLNNCVLNGGGDEELERIIREHRPSKHALTSHGVQKILDLELDTYDDIKKK